MYPVNLISTTLGLAAAVILCLVCFPGLPVQAESIPLDQSYQKSSLAYDGTVFEVSGMTGLTAPVVCNLWSPNITGGGLTFNGVDSTVASTLQTLSVNVTDARVLDATIYITKYLPRSSNLTIARTTAEMKGTTVLFNLQGFIPQYYMSVYLFDTTVRWTSGTGGDVLSIGGDIYTYLYKNGGIFLTHVNATGAKSMLNIAGSCTSQDICFRIETSYFGVDFATCKDCTGPFVEFGIHSVSIGEASFFRFSNCTHYSPNGDQPFIHATPQYSGGFLYNTHAGNFLLTGITTNGPFFLVEGVNNQATCVASAQLALQHLDAESFGFEGRSFYKTFGVNCDTYTGNLTFGGVKYTTDQEYLDLKVDVTKITDDFGKITNRLAYTLHDQVGVGQYSMVGCTRTNTHYGSVGEPMPPQEVVDKYQEQGITLERWERKRCNCHPGKIQPYCGSTFDPLLDPMGYTYAIPECTTDPESCQECRWGVWDVCDKCNPGYQFNDDGECILKTCAKTPCTGCVSPSGNTDICQGCLFPFDLNPLTRQCDICDFPFIFNPSTKLCDTCEDHYKMDGDMCVLKTCAKVPCTGCVSPSGNTDTCQGCLFPFALNPVTQQCDTCEDHYKMDGGKCVLKYCAKGLCTECEQPAGEDEACKTCAFPSTVDPITQQCDACEVHYKLVGSACVLKSCAKFPCTGCVDPSGNDDTCQGCLFPFTLDPSTGQCDTCVPGFKYIRENSTCVEKQCLVANCQSCVFDQEYQCNSCGSGSSLDGSSQCSAASVENNLGTVGLVGIIIAIIVVVIIVVFLLVYFLCCRDAKPAYEEVDHVEMKERTTSTQNKNLPYVEVEEETEVTLFQPEREGNEGNPLATNDEKSEQPTEEKGRQQRRARNIRRNHIDVEDVNLETMYSRENEIFEDM